MHNSTYSFKEKNWLSFLFALLVFSCGVNEKNKRTKIEDVAGSDEVATFMKSFEGRGALTDSSMATPPQQAVAAFHVAEDLALDLVLAEPQITQPLHMSFDQRGRLWVVQYNQYPYPKGLKVLGMDQYLRAKYNDIPKPPQMERKVPTRSPYLKTLMEMACSTNPLMRLPG